MRRDLLTSDTTVNNLPAVLESKLKRDFNFEFVINGDIHNFINVYTIIKN